MDSFLFENRTKILGALTTAVAGLLSMIAMQMFDATATAPALLSPQTLRWLVIILSLANLMLGGTTIAVGFSNTTAERVAASKATTATARAETAQQVVLALNAGPATQPIPVVPISPPIQPPS